MTDKMSHAILLESMQSSFDFHSARTVLNEVLQETEVGEKPDYDKGEIKRIIEQLRLSHRNVDRAASSMLTHFEPEPPPPSYLMEPAPLPYPVPSFEVAPPPVVEAEPVAEVAPVVEHVEEKKDEHKEEKAEETEEVDEVKEGTNKFEKKKKK